MGKIFWNMPAAIPAPTPRLVTQVSWRNALPFPLINSVSCQKAQVIRPIAPWIAQEMRTQIYQIVAPSAARGRS
jgi:hypothetical protein